jgi:heme/copper-type cytochrome/quinol oxidase subunit 1
MVGAFTPYTIKRRRVEIVRGYCYRFIQCSFPCGIIMLIFSLVFLILGTSQLIYIFHFNGCNTMNKKDSELNTNDILSISSSSSSFKCNRQTMKVLGITFVVSGLVLFLISLLVTKYSRSSEENNVIRTTTASLIGHKTKHKQQHHHHYPPPIPTSEHDPNHTIVSIR